jgi:hypothetical protein
MASNNCFDVILQKRRHPYNLQPQSAKREVCHYLNYRSNYICIHIYKIFLQYIPSTLYIYIYIVIHVTIS